MNKYIFFVIVFFFSSCSQVLGLNYFYDNFDYKDETKWNYTQTPESIFYSNGVVDLGTTTDYYYYYPLFINNQQNIFRIDVDWVLDVKFKYRSTAGYGDGIGVGFTGSNGDLFYQFGIWNDYEKGTHFYYNDFSSRTNGCVNFSNVYDTAGRDYKILRFSINEWHSFRIEKLGLKYNVYLDGNNIYVTNDNQCIPTNLWFGNKLTIGSGLWSLLSVDEVKISNGIDDEVEEVEPKIIIIPGFGASWNSEAIVYNRDVGNNGWNMTPFVKNYNGLINALNQNGLIENKDFYVWNYDWRKPLIDIVDNLNTFINDKIGSDEKVILIGHSLGGLTARIWAENNKDDSRLEKVITLGSPHLGSVDAYEAWNGGQISDLTKVSSIAFKTLLKLQSLSTNTEMDAVRRYTPLVKDLLPTFDFVSKYGVLLNSNQLKWKNDYLISKNNSGIDLGDTLKLFVGNGFKTSGTVVLKDNTYFDRVLGLWPDGRIDKINKEDGDGTVLVKSAAYNKTSYVNLESGHGDIVDKATNQIMTEIGLSQVSVVSETKNFLNNLVFFVGSPVNYSVKCDDKLFNETDGFVVIENKNYRLCKVNLVGTGSGAIHIVIGNTNNNDWFYLEKNISLDETLSVSIDPKNGQIINNRENINLLKSLIKKDLDGLFLLNQKDKNLKEAVKFFDKNQPRQIIKNIFQFRLKNNEDVFSRRIINNAKIWMSISEKCSSRGLYGGCAERLVNMGFAREKTRINRLSDDDWWLLEDSDL